MLTAIVIVAILLPFVFRSSSADLSYWSVGALGYFSYALLVAFLAVTAILGGTLDTLLLGVKSIPCLACCALLVIVGAARKVVSGSGYQTIRETNR